MATESSTSTESSQFDQLLAAINESKSSFKRDLAQLKEEVKKGQEEAAERVAKKAKREQPFEFTKKGNKHQFDFNERVVDVLDDALASIPSTSSDTSSEKVRKLLQEGMKLIDERQKLIKMADRSEFGWGLITEYQADELADNSEDERRIHKAEKAAEKRLIKKKKKMESQKATAQRRSSSRTGLGAGPYLETPRLGVSPLSATQLRPPSTRPLGPCYNCGELGHLKRTCPKPLGQNVHKYPFIDYVDNVLPPFGEEGAGLSDCECESKLRLDREVSDQMCYIIEESVNNSLNVKGRLRDRVSFWKEELLSQLLV